MPGDIKRELNPQESGRFVAVLFPRESEQDGTTNNKVYVIICALHLDGPHCALTAVNLTLCIRLAVLLASPKHYEFSPLPLWCRFLAH